MVRLHYVALRHACANAGHGPHDEDLDHIESTYLANRGEFLVGLVDGGIVAMGGLLRQSDTTALVKRMRVEPAFQRRGYGQAVLDRLEERARELGYSVLQLDTSSQLSAAHALYRKNGYVEIRREPRGDADLIVFEKRIAAG